MALVLAQSFRPGENDRINWHPNVQLSGNGVEVTTDDQGDWQNGAFYRYIPGRHEDSYAVTGRIDTSGRLDLRLRPYSPWVTPIIVGFARKRFHNTRIPTDWTSTPIVYFDLTTESSSNRRTNASVNLDSSGRVTIKAGSMSYDTNFIEKPNVWNYYEFKYLGQNSGGYFEMRANGQVIGRLDGDTFLPNTAVEPLDMVIIPTRTYGTPGNRDIRNAPLFAIEDIYLANGIGTINKDYLGDIRVRRLMPNAVGDLSQFVGSDGDSIDNHLLISGNIPSEGSYVSSAFSGDTDLYQMSDVDPSETGILGVSTRIYAGKPEPGVAGIKVVEKIGSSEREQNSISLGQGEPALYQSDFETTAPDGSLWTPEKINELQLGVRNE